MRVKDEQSRQIRGRRPHVRHDAHVALGIELREMLTNPVMSGLHCRRPIFDMGDTPRDAPREPQREDIAERGEQQEFAEDSRTHAVLHEKRGGDVKT